MRPREQIAELQGALSLESDFGDGAAHSDAIWWIELRALMAKVTCQDMRGSPGKRTNLYGSA